MPTVPKDNGRQLDQFNDLLRQSPIWQEFMRRNGINLSRVHLSDSQRRQLRSELERNGYAFPSGMEIDPAGNANQNQTLARNVAIGAGVGGLALTGLGAAGIGPFSGLFGGGAAASSGGAAASGGLLPSSHLPVSALMGGAPAITSQGISAGVGAGLGSMAGLGTAAGGGSGVAGSVLNWLREPRNLLGLAGAVPLAVNAFRGGPGGGGDGLGGVSGTEADLLEEIKKNLGLQRARFEAATPAFNAAQKLAMQMAPRSVQSGGPF